MEQHKAQHCWGTWEFSTTHCDPHTASTRGHNALKVVTTLSNKIWRTTHSYFFPLPTATPWARCIKIKNLQHSPICIALRRILIFWVFGITENSCLIQAALLYRKKKKLTFSVKTTNWERLQFVNERFSITNTNLLLEKKTPTDLCSLQNN